MVGESARVRVVLLDAQITSRDTAVHLALTSNHGYLR